MQVQGRRYNKPLKITSKTEQNLVSEKTLSTNPCKHQYKYPFSEPFKITLQKIAQYKYTHLQYDYSVFHTRKQQDPSCRIQNYS